MEDSWSAKENALNQECARVKAEWKALTDKLIGMKVMYKNLEAETQAEMKSKEDENKVLKQQVKEWKDKNVELENRITTVKAEFQGKLKDDVAIIESLKKDLVKKEEDLEVAIASTGMAAVYLKGFVGNATDAGG